MNRDDDCRPGGCGPCTCHDGRHSWIGICSQCERPRYVIVPSFPTTAVCVCPERPLPPLRGPEQLADATPPNAPVVGAMTAEELPPPQMPPPPAPLFMLWADDPAASYLAEIHAAFMERDPVAAVGWLFGMFNNHCTTPTLPGMGDSSRNIADAMRVYWTEKNPQRGRELPPTDHNWPKE